MSNRIEEGFERVTGANGEPYLTVAEVAEMLGTTSARVSQLCKSGEIPAQRFNYLWAILESDAQEYKRKRDERKGRAPQEA